MSRPVQRSAKPLRTLRVLRFVAGYTQLSLAEELQMFQVKISQYESGLDPTEDHGEILLQFFQNHPKTINMVRGVQIEDLTKPWREVKYRIASTS